MGIGIVCLNTHPQGALCVSERRIVISERPVGCPKKVDIHDVQAVVQTSIEDRTPSWNNLKASNRTAWLWPTVGVFLEIIQ